MGSVMMLSNHYSLSRAMRNENSIQLNKLLIIKAIIYWIFYNIIK